MVLDCALAKNKDNSKCLARKYFKSFPVVLKNSRLEKPRVSIVYKDRVENYDLRSVETKKQIDESNGPEVSYEYEHIYGKGWNPHHEIDILQNNGWKRVRDSEAIIWQDLE